MLGTQSTQLPLSATLCGHVLSCILFERDAGNRTGHLFGNGMLWT